MSPFTESTIEQAVIDWLKELGSSYSFESEIAFDSYVCKLASLWDSLLPKVMRGEVRVNYDWRRDGSGCAQS